MPAFKNLLNQVFGKLTVIDKIPPSGKPGSRVRWICKCECGNKIESASQYLICGKKTHCGCQSTKCKPITGLRFGKLIAVKSLKVTGKTPLSSISKYLFLCDCGNEILRYKEDVLYRGLTSCGCDNQNKFFSSRKTKTGRFGSRREAAISNKGSGYRTSANKNNLPFNLDDMDFVRLFEGNCTYCGRSPYEGGDKRQLNGIDKVIPKLGYVRENCVSCCWICNEMKKDRTKEWLIEHTTRIVNHSNPYINVINPATNFNLAF